MYSICINGELFQTFLLSRVHFEICDRLPISSNIDQFHERWGKKGAAMALGITQSLSSFSAFLSFCDIQETAL